MGWSPTIAVTEPLSVGSEVDTLNGRVRIVVELTRDEYFTDLDRRRQWNRDRGVPWRAGSYIPETKEFKPGKDIPSEFQYFYRVEPL